MTQLSIEQDVATQLSNLAAQIADMEDENGASPSVGDVLSAIPEELPGESYFDWSKLAFGYRINPDGDNTAEIEITSGSVNRGKRAPVIVNSTKKIITEDGQYVWMEYNLSTEVAIIADPSLAAPATDATTYRKLLYQFNLVNGVASLEYVGLTEIELPGVGA